MIILYSQIACQAVWVQISVCHWTTSQFYTSDAFHFINRSISLVPVKEIKCDVRIEIHLCTLRHYGTIVVRYRNIIIVRAIRASCHRYGLTITIWYRYTASCWLGSILVPLYGGINRSIYRQCYLLSGLTIIVLIKIPCENRHTRRHMAYHHLLIVAGRQCNRYDGITTIILARQDIVRESHIYCLGIVRSSQFSWYCLPCFRIYRNDRTILCLQGNLCIVSYGCTSFCSRNIIKACRCNLGSKVLCLPWHSLLNYQLMLLVVIPSYWRRTIGSTKLPCNIHILGNLTELLCIFGKQRVENDIIYNIVWLTEIIHMRTVSHPPFKGIALLEEQLVLCLDSEFLTYIYDFRWRYLTHYISICLLIYSVRHLWRTLYVRSFCRYASCLRLAIANHTIIVVRLILLCSIGSFSGSLYRCTTLNAVGITAIPLVWQFSTWLWVLCTSHCECLSFTTLNGMGLSVKIRCYSRCESIQNHNAFYNIRILTCCVTPKPIYKMTSLCDDNRHLGLVVIYIYISFGAILFESNHIINWNGWVVD